MNEKSKKILIIVLRSLLVSLIVCGIIYQAWKPIIKDMFTDKPAIEQLSGFKTIMTIPGRDGDANDTLKYRIISVFPEHDIRVDSQTGLVQLNCANLKYDTYKFWVEVRDKAGNTAKRSYIIKNLRMRE